MGMMHKGCDLGPRVWPWGVGFTGVVSVATALRDAFFACSWLHLDAMPFDDLGMNCVFPALLVMVIGVAVSGFRSSAVE